MPIKNKRYKKNNFKNRNHNVLIIIKLSLIYNNLNNKIKDKMLHKNDIHKLFFNRFNWLSFDSIYSISFYSFYLCFFAVKVSGIFVVNLLYCFCNSSHCFFNLFSKYSIYYYANLLSKGGGFLFLYYYANFYFLVLCLFT